MSTRMFDTFVFDMDGTLLNTLDDLTAVTNAALKHFGYPQHTKEEVRTFVGDGARTLIKTAMPRGKSDQEIDETVAYWQQTYLEMGSPYTRPYDHMVDVLKSMKAAGIKIGILSNKFDTAVCELAEEYFGGLYGVAHGEAPDIPRKPNPTGLLRTISELGSTPEMTAYIGDSGADIHVAKNAQTFSIGAGWGFNTREALMDEGADVVLLDPSELRQFFK